MYGDTYPIYQYFSVSCESAETYKVRKVAKLDVPQDH